MTTSRRITRRQFIEESLAGSLAANAAWKMNPRRVNASPSASGAGGLSLQVRGDSRQGFGVVIQSGGRPIAQHNGGGEFSAVFQNGERSVEDRVENWKATSWTRDATHVALKGECKLKNLNTSVLVEVDYAVVTPQVVRKQVRLHQSDMYVLFYQVSNRLEPTEPPAKFWSFNQTDCAGGALHEYFPAAGFRTQDDLTVGLLTDAGFRNQWSRLIRRDGKPVKPAPRRIPDAHLYSVCRPEERAASQFFVQQTFGEALVRAAGGVPGENVELAPISSWSKRGEVTLKEREGAIVVSVRSSEDGVVIPFPARDGEVYSLRLQYRSPQAFAVEVWDVDDRLQELEDITLYNDRVPESPGSWSEFRTSVFFYARRGRSGALFISLAESEQATSLKAPGGVGIIEMRGLEVRRLSTRCEPYHRLEMDRPEQKTVFIFVAGKTPETVRGYRLASQLHLADALGFRGGQTEKVLYADLMMLSWMAGPETPGPMLAPSIWYSAAGEMYFRDSFFALNGVHNRDLNERVFNLWADNQGTNGAINTLVEPNMANLERKSNDSTPLWLMWALLNRRRFSTKLPMDKVRKAADYCLRTYDPDRDGICWAQFVIGENDVIDFPEGTTDICTSQGMWAVTLRVIKELNIPGISENISEDYIAKAEEAYRSYYDPARKIIRPARKVTDAIGFDEIFPEFLSLWLFHRKILTGEMMCNHLDRMPVFLPREDAPYPETGGTARAVLIGITEDRKGWRYASDTWHPMISDSFAANYANHSMDGIYYNGGSWMRIEICGYVAGKLHGWSKADKAIANRLWAELNIAPDFPTSQEYLATDPAHPFFGYHRVFAWNSFVLLALELAGLRKPEMDPDYSPPGLSE
ncbi:MAG: hypothetical protein ABSE93_15880 [Terriglobia bacterium]|jgi:hypothetical protein